MVCLFKNLINLLFAFFFLFQQGLYQETFVEERSRVRRNGSPISSSSAEQRRVREMIDRLESSSGNTKETKSFSTKKSLHDDHSDGSITVTSSPSFKRYTYRHRSPHDNIVFRDNNSNGTRFELNRDEVRTASGTTVS